MAYPTTLTNAQDDSVPGAGDGTLYVAAHLNNLEAKVGVDGSAVVTSIDYLLKNVASVDPGHKHDHGGLQGLEDDDHTQYINHALATAASDFLVASGPGAYVKKTLAETKAILELPASPYVIGDLLYASAVNTLSKLPAVAVGQVLVSGGAGAAFAWSGAPTLSTSLTVPTIIAPAASLVLKPTTDGLTAIQLCDKDGNAILNVDTTNDRVGIGTTSFGTSAIKVLGMGSGTAPTTAPADMAQIWVEDINGAAGYAGLHKRTETTNQKEVVPGVIIKTDTGSPANPYEGLLEINTFDNQFRGYAEAAWRTLARWDYTVGDLLYASAVNTLSKLPAVAVGQVLVSGGVGTAPAWGKVALTTHVTGVLPPVNGGDGGTTASASGPVTVTTTLNRQTYVATGAVEYDLPTGDLSAFVAVGAVPLKYTFVKSAAGTLTIDPGAGNFIANGIAAATLYDDVSGETWATVVLQLVSSAGSVNKWVIVGAHGTWAT